MIIVFVMVGFAVCVAMILIGVALIVLMFLPFYLFFAGLFLVLIRRHRRQQQILDCELLMKAERERRLYAQEFGVWQSAASDPQWRAK